MKSLEELQAIRDKMKAQLSARGTIGSEDISIIVGMSTCGISAGARKVLNTFSEEIESKHLNNVKLGQTGCIGLCKLEPIVEVTLPGKPKVTYAKVDSDKAREIVSSHIVNGTPVQEYVLAEVNRQGEKYD